MSGIKFWNGGMSFYTFNLSKKAPKKFCPQKNRFFGNLANFQNSFLAKTFLGALFTVFWPKNRFIWDFANFLKSWVQNHVWADTLHMHRLLIRDQ
jgi:hypothetical protein